MSRSILVAQVKEKEEEEAIQGIPCCLLGQRLPLPLGMVFNNVLQFTPHGHADIKSISLYKTKYISVTLVSVNSTLSRSFLPRGWGKTGG